MEALAEAQAEAAEAAAAVEARGTPRGLRGLVGRRGRRRLREALEAADEEAAQAPARDLGDGSGCLKGRGYMTLVAVPCWGVIGDGHPHYDLGGEPATPRFLSPIAAAPHLVRGRRRRTSLWRAEA